MSNNLSTKVTADVVDLQSKFAIARAETSALTAEMSKLARQSASGVIDEAGTARLQQVAGDMLHAKEAASELGAELKRVTGSAEEMSNPFEQFREQVRSLSGLKEALGLAALVEGFHQLGEVIEKVGKDALELRSVSEVLGLTTDQLQALQAASREAGVGQEQTTRAGEKLVVMLDEARGGSESAIDQLTALGVSIKQVGDPAFQLNDLLQLLHDRLTNSATASSTQSQLLQDFGSRAGLVVEVLKQYNGTAAGVAEVMKKLGGQSQEEVGQLKEMAIWWDTVSTKVSNAAKSMFAAIYSAASSDQMNGVGDGMLEQIQAAKEKAEETASQQKNTTPPPNIAPSQAALQQLADYAQQLDTRVRNEHARTMEEITAFNLKAAKEQESQLQELSDFAQSLDTRVTIQKTRDMEEQARAATAAATEQERQLEELSNYAQELDTRVTKEHAKGLEEMAALNARQTKEMQKDWQFLSTSMASSLTTSLEGMLARTQTVGGAMRSMFESVFDGIIKKLAEWVSQWITQHLIALIANKNLAASEVTTNAGVAASGAMASVAAIPFVGWAMAPAVGLETYAEALAIGLPSLDVGAWQVPHDMTARIHKDESVVPKNFADGMRDNGAFSGASKGRGGGGGDTNHNYNGDLNVNVGNGRSDLLSTSRGQKELVKNLNSVVRRGGGRR